MENKEMIKEELTQMLENCYNNSFIQLVCDYISHTRMSSEEVEELQETMRGELVI